MTIRTARRTPPLLLVLLLGTILTGFSGCADETEEQATAEAGSRSAVEEAGDSGSAESPVDTGGTRTAAGGPESASGVLYLHRAKETVGRSIPSVLIESVEVDGPTMHVVLRENQSIPAYTDYYDIADQRNRIIAIESVRWFRDLPAMQTLHLKLPGPKGTEEYTLDREKVAEFYSISLRSLAEHPDEKYWRENFLVRWDNDRDRGNFANAFR